MPSMSLHVLIFSANNVCFPVELTTKTWAREISWSIGSCSSNQVYKNRKVYAKQCCLAPGDHTLNCKDSYGDGWQGGFIEIYGRRYCEDFKSGKLSTAPVNIGTSTPTSKSPCQVQITNTFIKQP